VRTSSHAQFGAWLTFRLNAMRIQTCGLGSLTTLAECLFSFTPLPGQRASGTARRTLPR